MVKGPLSPLSSAAQSSSTAVEQAQNAAEQWPPRTVEWGCPALQSWSNALVQGERAPLAHCGFGLLLGQPSVAPWWVDWEGGDTAPGAVEGTCP